MADSTLGAIRTKVRRLTRSPSTAQLSDADIDQYVNTFVLYDFPEHLRLFSLRSTLTFYTQPGVDTYATNTTNPLDPLYNFQNKYIAVHPPLFIAGVPSFFTQWRDVFYGQWPQTNAVVDTLIDGNGTVGPFSGVINTFPQFPSAPAPNGGAILQNSLVLSALDVNGIAMQVVDYPQNVALVNPSNIIGLLDIPNQIPTAVSNLGTINYQTGAFTVEFPNNTLIGDTNPIWAEYVPYVAGLPISALYYDNQFTIRPVPDKTYSVQIEVDVRPSELLDAGLSPKIEQWWQFIAYGAAKKIFEDRMDLDSVQQIMPEYKNQLNFVNRTSLVQQANERTVTIYTTGKNYGWPWSNGAGNFPF
jgi:hypothetical protein